MADPITRPPAESAAGTDAFRSELVAYTDGQYEPSFVPTGILLETAGIVTGQLTGSGSDPDDDAGDLEYPLIAGVIHKLSFQVIREVGTITGIIQVVRGPGR